MASSTTKIVTGTAALVTAAALAMVGTSLARADDASPTATSSSSAAAGSGQSQDQNRPAPHAHTEVTGDELTKVTDAVTAKDSTITVTKVMKDEDGSYDVFGTKAGAQVMANVSKDLATIDVRTGGPGGMGGMDGKGGRGGMNGPGHSHTEVTGAELTKVTDAVKAKDSAVTVTKVMKDEDGSYDVFGTKAGAQVMVEVSKDLATIEVRTGGPGMGGMGGRGGMRGDGHHGMGGTQGGTQDPNGSSTPTDPNSPSASATGAVYAV